MTKDQDRELARRLAEMDTPEHGASFWSDLRTANSTRAASGTDAHFVENEDAGNSTRATSVADAHFVENEESARLDDRRRRRVAPTRWIAAAAVLLVALIGGAVALDRTGNEAQDLSTSPTEPMDPDQPGDPGVFGDPARPLRPDGDPVERGPGSVVAVDPTGEFLYVAEEDAAGEPGCEGQPSPVLMVEPVDGGERRQVLAPDVGSVTGSYQVRFGPEGEIAVVTQCEGFGATIVTGTVGADGTISDPTELTIPDVDLGRNVDGILDLEFRGAGTMVAITRTVAGDGTEHRHLYEFPVGPSEVTDLGQDDVMALDVTAEGRLVTASADGTIRLDGEIVATLEGAFGVAVSPSGRTAVVAGGSDAGLVAVDLATGAATALPGTNLADAGSIDVPNEDVVVYGSSESATMLVDSMPLGEADPQSSLIARGAVGSPVVVSRDLSRVFVTGWSSDGAPVVLEQPLTR